MRYEVQIEPEEGILDALADTVVIGLARPGHFGIDTTVARRHAEVWRTLKHRQVLGLLRDLRDRLHRRGPRADDADTLGGEVDAIMRPLARVVTLARKGAQPLDRRHVGGRQGTDGRDDEARRDGVAFVGAHGPQLGVVIEDDFDDALAKLDVGLQVEALGAVLEVAQDLVLLRIALGPVPFLQQVLVERVTVDVAVGVAACAGIAIPVPGAADAVAGLEHRDVQVKLVA